METKLRIFTVILINNLQLFVYYLLALDMPAVNFQFKFCDIFLRSCSYFAIIYFILRKASKPIRNMQTYRCWFFMLNLIFCVSTITIFVFVVIAEVSMFATDEYHYVVTEHLLEDRSNQKDMRTNFIKVQNDVCSSGLWLATGLFLVLYAALLRCFIYKINATIRDQIKKE